MKTLSSPTIPAPPPIQGDPGAGESEEDVEVIILTDETFEIAQTLRDARRNAAQWTAIGDEAKAALLQLRKTNGSATLVSAEGVTVININVGSSSRVDRKKLEAQFPQIAAQVIGDQSQTRVELDNEFK